MEGDPLDVEPGEELGREVESGGRRRCRARDVRVDGLVALRVGERLRDVRGKRRLPCRLPVEPDTPPALAEVLEQLDRAVAAAGLQAPRRPRERLPEPLADALEQEDFAPWGVDRMRAGTTRVSFTTTSVSPPISRARSANIRWRTEPSRRR